MAYIVFSNHSPNIPIQWFSTREQAEDFIDREPSIVRDNYFIREDNPSAYVPPGATYTNRRPL